MVNTRSGAALETDPAVDAWLFDDGAWPDGIDTGPLHAHGLAVPRDVVEVQQVAADYARARATDELLLTIAPTVACNLRCPYCFETEHPNRYLDRDEVDAIVRMVRRRLRDGARSLSITWFGGEPLLHLDGIRRLTGLLRPLATFAGATYRSNIITNGTRLTGDTAAELARLGVEFAQISLDGDQPRHDATRIDIRGRGTFDRILAAIEAATAHLAVVVRIQVDRRSAPTVPGLLDRIAERGIPRLVIDFVALDPPSMFQPGPSDDSLFLTVAEFAEAEIRWRRQAAALGLDTGGGGLQPVNEPAPCAAVHSGHLGVEPGGHVTRCWADVADPGGRVGRLDENGLQIDGRDDAWRRHLPFDHGCETCAVLPLCVGGCPKARLTGGMHDGTEAARVEFKERFVCSPRRYNLATLAAEGLL